MFQRQQKVLPLLLSGFLAATCRAQEVVDCSEFQHSLQLSPSLNMDYVVNLDDPEDTSEYPQGILSAQLTLEGQGWVSLGHTAGSASMVPGDAVIGLPDEPLGSNNPGKYQMTLKSASGVLLYPEEQQTLMNAEVTQTETTTTLSFDKILVEPNEIPIDGNGRTTFLWAHGFGNDLSMHSGRGAFELTLTPCNVVGGTGDNTDGNKDDEVTILETPDTHRSLWTSHGVLAGVSWGILVPLAISSTLLRQLIPKPLWFQIHFFFNLAAAICTLVSFVLAVVAQNKTTPEGASPNHFAGLAHKTLGLVITIIVCFQVVAGFMRPHPPAAKTTTDEEDQQSQEPPKKTKLRIAWEVLHKLFGFSLLGMAWWQCQDGLKLYASRFNTQDLVYIFWIVVGCIAGVTLVFMIYSKFSGKTNEEDESESCSSSDQSPAKNDEVES